MFQYFFAGPQIPDGNAYRNNEPNSQIAMKDKGNKFNYLYF